jgi:type I restriction-modification system DNA methylase subunit
LLLYKDLKKKGGKNQRTRLALEEEQRIIDTVNNTADDGGFSVVKTLDELKAGKYSFNPGAILMWLLSKSRFRQTISQRE